MTDVPRRVRAAQVAAATRSTTRTPTPLAAVDPALVKVAGPLQGVSAMRRRRSRRRRCSAPASSPSTTSPGSRRRAARRARRRRRARARAREARREALRRAGGRRPTGARRSTARDVEAVVDRDARRHARDDRRAPRRRRARRSCCRSRWPAASRGCRAHHRGRGDARRRPAGQLHASLFRGGRQARAPGSTRARSAACSRARIRNATPGPDWGDWFFRTRRVGDGVVDQLGVHGIDLRASICWAAFASVGARARIAVPSAHACATARSSQVENVGQRAARPTSSTAARWSRTRCR